MQPHAEIKKDRRGVIHAISGGLGLTILPDGEARAFNRNFLKKTMGGGPLHARLNNLAARIQQGKISKEDAWKEVCKWVEHEQAPKHTRWLVGELDGVRCYINGDSVIMTKRDLYE